MASTVIPTRLGINYRHVECGGAGGRTHPPKKIFDPCHMPELYTMTLASFYGIQNYIHWWPKIDLFKGNYCILRIGIAPSHQKIGIILENIVFYLLTLL